MGRIRVPKSGQIHPNGQAAPAASANTTGLVLPKTKTEVSGSGNSGQKIEPLEEEKSWWDSAVSAVASMDTHEVLDTVGLIPGLGIAADLSNAALYAYEGDYVNASVSAAAASPIGGQAVTAAKYAKKAASTAMGTGGKKAVKNEVKEEAASKAAKGEPKASSGSGGNGGPPDKPPKKTDEPEPEEPKKGDGKDGGYVEGGGKGKKGKSREEIFGDDRTPKASELKQYAEEQGWKPVQSDGGPLKYVDENGTARLTIKQGSSRAPGSSNPHVELKDATGQRIDPAGNHVTRRSVGNHTPIDYDL